MKLSDVQRRRLERIHIRRYSGAVPERLCIMQAVNYIQGRDYFPYSPPCVSDIITAVMVGINDSPKTSEEERQRLKELVPEIINTAPLIDGATDRDRPEYKAAEARRREIWYKHFAPDAPIGSEGDYPNPDGLERMSFDEQLAFVRELAAVAHFNESATNERSPQ